MKNAIEKLLNHLGLAADTTEEVVLEKMAGLPALGVLAELQNRVTELQAENTKLTHGLKAIQGELVNRELQDFDGIVTAGNRDFWAGQLLTNREKTLEVLGDLVKMKPETGNLRPEGNQEQTRKPLHNRATARPVPPTGSTGSPQAGSGAAFSRAVKIRNRAQELVKAEGVPFSVAFRRAEKEVCDN